MYRSNHINYYSVLERILQRLVRVFLKTANMSNVCYMYIYIVNGISTE